MNAAVDKDGNTGAFPGTFALYQDPGYAGIVARHLKLAVVENRGLLVLFRKIPLIGYTRGILGSPELSGPFPEWWERLAPLKFGQLEIHTTNAIDTFRRSLVSPEDNYSMVIALPSDESLLPAKFNRGCRRAIMAGQKNGVSVVCAQDARDLRRFYDICVKVSDDGRLFPVPPFNLVADLFRSRYGKLFVTLWQGKIVGGLFFLLGTSMHGWIGGIDRGFSHVKPGNVMHLEAMRWGISNGYRYYDMGEQSIGRNSALTQFKLSFGPALIPAYVYDVSTSRLNSLVARSRGVFGNHTSPGSIPAQPSRQPGNGEL